MPAATPTDILFHGFMMPSPNRLLKKAHLSIADCGMWNPRAASHLDLFEQPGEKSVFEHPA
jgi:hypothetical protein